MFSHSRQNEGLRGTRVGAEEISLVHGTKPVHRRRPPIVMLFVLLLFLLLAIALFVNLINSLHAPVAHYNIFSSCRLIKLFLAARIPRSPISLLCIIKLFLAAFFWRSPISFVPSMRDFLVAISQKKIFRKRRGPAEQVIAKPTPHYSIRRSAFAPKSIR